MGGERDDLGTGEQHVRGRGEPDDARVAACVTIGLLPDENHGGWVASALAGSSSLGSPGTDACVAASRSDDFVTGVG